MKRKLALLASGLAVCSLGGAALSQDGVEFDTDRYGGDYRELNLRPGEDYQVCAQACVDDQRCVAWTWVPQGAQRAEGPNCWLKDSVSDASQQSGLVSGMRGFGVARVSATADSTGAVTATGAAPATQTPRLVLFEGDGFAGRSVTFDRDVANLHIESLEFGDATWSLAAEGRWALCEHVDFGGECRTFEGDHAGLQDWGGTISSARYLGPGASSQVINGSTDSGAGGVTGGDSGWTGAGGSERRPGVVESAAERAARVAAEEAESRVHDRIREGIGRIFR